MNKTHSLFVALVMIFYTSFAYTMTEQNDKQPRYGYFVVQYKTANTPAPTPYHAPADIIARFTAKNQQYTVFVKYGTTKKGKDPLDQLEAFYKGITEFKKTSIEFED